MKMSNGMFVFPNSDKVYVDQEWIDAWNTPDKPEYYKCTMLNHGTCYKQYKPAVAKLMLERGAYYNMTNVKTGELLIKGAMTYD